MRAVLIACPFDNGIRSMLRFGRGVAGAAHGPRAVLNAFSEIGGTCREQVEVSVLPLGNYNSEVTGENVLLPDFKKMQNDCTRKAHEIIRQKTKMFCSDGYIPIGVGGDHSITYPLCKGLSEAYPGKKIGVIYLDSHLDLRSLENDSDVRGVISSGNSFWRLVEDGELGISGKNVVAIGIHETKSKEFREQKTYADLRGVRIVHDNQMNNLKKVAGSALKAAGNGTDLIYLSLDMDAVSEQFAPGVSAPAERGISEEQLYGLIGLLSKDKKIAGFDLAEVSSRERAWYEVIGNKKRHETYATRMNKLQQTAHIAAKAICCFIEGKFGVRNEI